MFHKWGTNIQEKDTNIKNNVVFQTENKVIL